MVPPTNFRCLVQSLLIAPLLKIACIEPPLLLAVKRLRFTRRKWSIEPEEVV